MTPTNDRSSRRAARRGGPAGQRRRSTGGGASAFYDLPKNHPIALPLLLSQVPVGPNALLHRERSVAVLLACGFPLDLAARAYTAVAHYVLGLALQQHAPAAPQREDAAKLRDFYRALDANTYPATVAAADE